MKLKLSKVAGSLPDGGNGTILHLQGLKEEMKQEEKLLSALTEELNLSLSSTKESPCSSSRRTGGWEAS